METGSVKKYDLVVAGDGCSGMLFLHALSKFPDFQNLTILLIGAGENLERSWCFWDNALPEPFQGLVHSSWPALTFNADQFSTTQNLGKFSYHYIPGNNFISFFRKEFLPQFKNIHYVEDLVKDIDGKNGEFIVHTRNQTYFSSKFYNSLFLGERPSISLWQHFRGWFIETPNPVFKVGQATLMDFNVSQERGCSFMYVLPLSETRALVELTFLGPEIWHISTYEQELSHYITQHFGKDYTIVDREFGKIPMQQGVFHPMGPKGEVNLGTVGGMVKSSTGYAFQRIRKDSEALAAAFFSGVSPVRTSEHSRFGFYDGLLLWIIKNEPSACKNIFTSLFKRKKMDLILRFMDQQTSVWEEISIFARLPLFIFLKALFFTRFKKASEVNSVTPEAASVVHA